MSDTVAVSLVIPTYMRVEKLRKTLDVVKNCVPRPVEILVHVDAGDVATIPMLNSEYPSVKVIQSETRQGPGGGRNKLITAASHNTVVSLDDDSWPLDCSFFYYAKQLADSRRSVGVYACRIIEADESREALPAALDPHAVSLLTCEPASGFVGCGCIYRRDSFCEIEGYLPLQQAYGMEEVDVALQFMNRRYEVRYVADLWVYHDCDRELHHADPRINGAQIRNAALLTAIRYPFSLWPKGMLQVANRTLFSIRKGRFRGIISGLASIPFALLKYRKYRRPLKSETLRKYWELRE